MCRGSVRARSTEDAEFGVDYQITRTSYGNKHRHGVLHRPGNGRDEHGMVACAACIRTPTAVRLAGIPDYLQKRLGIDAADVDALFLPGPEDGSDMSDQIELVDGRTLPLWRFSNTRIILTLVTIDAIKDTTAMPPELADLPSGSLVDMMV